MRKYLSLNKGWTFTKTTPSSLDTIPENDVCKIDLPHTWNAEDGQDGGNDYYRGKGYYFLPLDLSDYTSGELFVEFQGVNSTAQVYMDGVNVGFHHGGYSTFRVDVSEYKGRRALLAVMADNSPSDTVYPQMADFTFYGGIYRSVTLISVDERHFELSYFGGEGIQVTPRLFDGRAEIDVSVFFHVPYPDKSILFEILDADGSVVATDTLFADKMKVTSTLTVYNPHLWDGVFDPYLYRARATLFDQEKSYDIVTANFGCRSFEVSASRGFILNGREYALRGVSRHQDRLGIGNALTREHHDEDMALIRELGANTIRLAHYQHDQYFYDLCDRFGIVVWAEIPYISTHMDEGYDNTLLQMKELIVQNYNHPSICFWGMSNEITMGGYDKSELVENHRALQELCHSLDTTRYTTVAVLTMCPTDARYLQIPDLIAYNHYFGWYGGDTSMNGEWFDNFHAEYPLRPIAISEYGCEGADWHASNIMQGDYTEEYQAYYHEELIKQLYPRKFIWATYVWNMFDFGADARAEAGEPGQNHKGLVTFDRKYKKDAFYAYKAHLSKEPFVHIAGKRYVDRVESETQITVYSNLDTVELFANSESVGVVTAPDHFFKFKVKNEGETELVAVSGEFSDTARIRRVDTFNEDYILKEKGAVLNWFDITEPEGCLSLNTKLSEIIATHEGERVVGEFMSKLLDALPPEARMMGEGVFKMMGSFTLLRLTSLMSMMDVNFTKEELLTLNRRLNRIRKPLKQKT